MKEGMISWMDFLSSLNVSGTADDNTTKVNATANTASLNVSIRVWLSPL